MNLPVAHIGHWALWVLYAIPVLIVLGSIFVSARRDRRAQRSPTGPGDATEQP